MAKLLTIRSDSIDLEFSGPTSPQGGFVRSGVTPELLIDPLASEVEATYVDTSGTEHPWSPDRSEGPTFFEDTQYALQIRGPARSHVTVTTRNQSIFSDVTPVLGEPNTLAGTVNFRRSVGRFAFDVAVDGARWLAVSIDVYPSKMDYRADYEQLVTDIESLRRRLSMAFLRTTHRSGGVSGDKSELADLLTLLRSEIHRLEQAFRQIERRPRRQLSPSIVLRETAKLRRPTTGVLRQIVRGSGAGPLESLIPGVSARRYLHAHRGQETLDTAEHRWLRATLADLVRLAAQGRSRVDTAIEISRRRDFSTARYETEKAELIDLGKRLVDLLAIEPLSAATGPPPAGFSSQALQRTPGYREATSSLHTLRSAVTALGQGHQTSMQEIDALYEVWCFLKVAEIVGDLVGAEDFVVEPSVRQSGLDSLLSSGRASTIRLEGTGRDFHVGYNLEYRESTGRHRPDIVLDVRVEDWPPMIIVLDAKYRLRSDRSTIAKYEVPSPPQDAIDALHRYRDAITIEHSSHRGRPVVLGAALYPLGVHESLHYDRRPLYRSLSTVGIGALPFLPGNTSHVRRFLADIVQAPPTELSDPGPPFLASSYARALQI